MGVGWGGGSEELEEACRKGSRAQEVTERHGGGLVQGEGLPRLYPSLTPQSGAKRARQALGASCILITSTCQEVGCPSQTAPGRGVGSGGRRHNTSLQKSFSFKGVCPHPVHFPIVSYIGDGF